MNKEDYEKAFEAAERMLGQKLKEKMIELQPQLGCFTKAEAPIILFAIDAYREEIVKRVPEAEDIAAEIKERFGVHAQDLAQFETADGKKVRYTFKESKR